MPFKLHDNPMDNTFGLSEVLDVEIKDTDLDKAAGEVLPVGSSIKVHQIILKEKKPEDEKKKTLFKLPQERQKQVG
jgi:hypothetical protein